jgi:hypothetical protein
VHVAKIDIGYKKFGLVYKERLVGELNVLIARMYVQRKPLIAFPWDRGKMTTVTDL